MQIALVSLTVTRDAMTRLPATVPAHEVEIMQNVFGEDNVQIHEGEAGSVELDPAMEGERLAGKYGEGVIQALHGANFKSALSRICSSHATDKPAKGKAAVAA